MAERARPDHRGGGSLLIGSLLAFAMAFAFDDAYAQSYQRHGVHITDNSFAENVGNATFEISNRTSATREFRLSLLNGIGQTGATLGQDFRAITGTANFSLPPNGNNPRSVSIPIIDDADREDAETFGIKVFIVGEGDFTIPIIIEKNDQPPTATLSISPRTEVSIMEGATQEYMVTLSGAQAQEVTVKCRTQDFPGGALAGEDYEPVDVPLTFAPGDTAQTCSLVTIADDVDEFDTETVSFGLADVAGGDFETDGSGGAAIATGHDTFNVTITDNDDPPSIWLEQANRNARVSEGIATYEFTVRLSEASGKSDFALGYRFSGTATLGHDDAAKAGEDYTVSGGTVNALGINSRDGTGQLTINGGETSKTLAIKIADDQLKELRRPYIGSGITRFCSRYFSYFFELFYKNFA